MVSKNKYDIHQNLYFHPKLILEYLRCGTRDQGSAGEDVPGHEQTFEEPGQRRIPDGHQYKLLTSEVLQYNKMRDIVCMSHDAVPPMWRWVPPTWTDTLGRPSSSGPGLWTVTGTSSGPSPSSRRWTGCPHTGDTPYTSDCSSGAVHVPREPPVCKPQKEGIEKFMSYPDHVIHLPAPGWWLAAWSTTPQRRTASATRPGHTPALPPSPSPRSQPSWVLILLLSL